MKTLSIGLAVALISLLAACSSGGQRRSGEEGTGSAVAAAGDDAKLALRHGMRKLWTDHVVWTRMYIIAAVGNNPDNGAAAARLLKNQEDIGNAVAGYYGNDAGARMTVLLKEHITIAVDLIEAAKVSDTEKYMKIDADWTRNAADIADFLSKANPNWPRQALVDMMNLHLSTTVDEVKARLNKDWELDVSTFEEVYEHILEMADTLSDGIIKQFPDRFKG